MAEFKSPGFKITERRKGPVVPPVGISGAAIGGLQGYTKMGPIDDPLVVTSMADYEELFGTRPVSSEPAYLHMYDSATNFFKQVGTSASALLYINRILSTSNATASRTVNATSNATSGTDTSNPGSFPAALPHGTVFDGTVDGGAVPGFNIVAYAAAATGAGATYAAGAGGDNLVIEIGNIGGGAQTIDLSAVGATQVDYLDAINTQIIGARAVDQGGEIRIITDMRGTNASGFIVSVGGAAGAKTGLSAGAFVALGVSTVDDDQAVTAAEFAALATVAFPGSTFTANADDSVTWTSSTTGAASSVQFTLPSNIAALIPGFDLVAHSGANSSTAGVLTIEASSPGAWGNDVRTLVTRTSSTATTLATTYVAGSVTSLQVTSANRLRVGDQISITEGLDTQRNRISAIHTTTPPTIFLESAITVPGAGYDTANTVVVESFTVDVYDNTGALRFSYPNLQVSSVSANFADNIVNNSSRTWINVTVNTGVLPAFPLDQRPNTDSSSTVLSGGSDGAGSPAISSTQHVGSLANKTGVYAWDKVPDVDMISIPGLCEWGFNSAQELAVIKALEGYCDTRGDVLAIFDPPNGLLPSTNPGELVEWATTTINFASSQSAVYYPWATIQDPNGSQLATPPSGIVQGIISRTHAQRNIGKAPAGIVDGQVRGIIGMQYALQEGVQYDLIYPQGINGILVFPGSGIAVFGNTTMDITGEYAALNVRIVFNKVKRALKTLTRWVNFEPNNADTRTTVRTQIGAYLRDLQLKGVLRGTLPDEGYFIICDETNNTELVIQQRKLKIRVGLAVEQAAEFVDTEIEQDTRAFNAA